MFVNLCLCVYKRGRGAGYFYLHHRSLSAAQPSDLGCSILDLQCLTSMLGDCCRTSPSQVQVSLLCTRALLMHHILRRQEESG